MTTTIIILGVLTALLLWLVYNQRTTINDLNKVIKSSDKEIQELILDNEQLEYDYDVLEEDCEILLEKEQEKYENLKKQLKK